MRRWLVLSALLRYPDEELLELGDELPRWMQGRPLGELQEEYVRTFDFERRAALHITYHTHGDKRQRGLELVRLKRRLAEAGCFVQGSELPDYLPVLLEFAALEPKQGRALLAEHRPALELVRATLHAQRSPYAALLDEICAALPGLTRAQREAARRLAQEGPPAELVGLEAYGVPEGMSA